MIVLSIADVIVADKRNCLLFGNVRGNPVASIISKRTSRPFSGAAGLNLKGVFRDRKTLRIRVTK